VAQVVDRHGGNCATFRAVANHDLEPRLLRTRFM
jgi:hypothetical protein